MGFTESGFIFQPVSLGVVHCLCSCGANFCMLPETYLAEKQSFVVQKPFHSLASSRYSVSQASKQAGRQPARAAHLDTKRTTTTTTTIVLRLCFVCTHTKREIEIYTHRGRQGDRETDKLANYTINSNSKSPLTDLLYKWFYISFYVVQPELYTESESGRVGTLEWRLCCAVRIHLQLSLSSARFSSVQLQLALLLLLLQLLLHLHRFASLDSPAFLSLISIGTLS